MAKIGESPSNFVRIPSACARKNLGLNPNAFLGGEKVGFPGPASEIKSVLLSHTAVQNVFIAGKHSKAVRDANRVFAQAILGHRDMHQCNACARYFNCKRNLNEHFERKNYDCMKEDYLLPTVIGNKYFCYLGCRSLWLSKVGMMKHYVDEHFGYEDS